MSASDFVNIAMWGILVLAIVGIGWVGWCIYQEYKVDKEIAEIREAEAGEVITEDLEHKDAD